MRITAEGILAAVITACENVASTYCAIDHIVGVAESYGATMFRAR